MTHLDFVNPFYERTHSRDDFVSAVEGVMSSQPRAIKATAIPFSTTLNPEIDFAAYATKNRKIRLIKKGEGLSLFELEYRFRDGTHTRTESGKFYVLSHVNFKNVFITVSIEPSSFVRRGLLPFLRSRFPLLVTGFLPQARLNRLLTTFRDKYLYSDLIVTRTTQRLRLSEEGTHRRIMPMMSWPEMSLVEAIDWIAEHDGWFQSVQFQAKRRNQVAMEASLTREGLVKCDNLLSQVWDAFVEPICKMHNENFNLFSSRGRRESPSLQARPLIVKFEDDQFEHVEENKRLIQAMRTMKTASVSVLHGNPYIHMGLIDYLDGSAFDLWVLDTRSLIIVPQMHSSVGAIKRLVNHVFDTYAEGDVADYASEYQ